MLLRKERTHHSGSSNISLHERLCHLINPLSEPQAEENRTTRSRLFHTSHARSQETVKKRLENSEASPVEGTKRFYQIQGKIPILRTLFGYPRTSLLEDKDKQGPAFTGDTNIVSKVSLQKCRSKSSDVLRKNVSGKLEENKNKSSFKVIKKKQKIGTTGFDETISKDYENKEKNQEDNLLDKAKSQENIQAMQKIKHKNQLILLLKNRLPELSRNLQENDEGSTGYLTPYLFEQAINKLRIHENALSAEDIKILYDEHKITPARLDYQNFVKHVDEFKFPYDQDYQKSSQAKLGQTCQGFNIVDCRTLPYNMMVNYFKKSHKVGGALKRFLPTKSDLSEYLEKTLNMPKEDIQTRNFSQKEFKGIVDGFLDKFNLSYLNQFEFEGFFSSVLFNRNGFTSFEEISKTIYEEKEGDYLLKIQMKKKGPAPFNDVKLSERVSDRDIGDPKNGQVIDEEKNRAHQSCMRGTKLPFFSKKACSKSVIEQAQELDDTRKSLDKDLEAILNKVDTQVFVGTKSALKTFREFDVDGDGYASYRDITQKLKTSNIINEESIPKFLKYLDPQRKGYVDFQTFSRKVRRNMANDSENGQALRKTIAMLKKPDFEKDLRVAENTKIIIDTFKRKCDPNAMTSKDVKGKTKSGANPAWVNTFLNMQPDSDSAMFVSEKERFERDSFSARTGFQVEDKLRTTSTQDRRVENIRNNQDTISARIRERNSWMKQRDQSNLERISMSQTAYQNTTRRGTSIF